MALEIVNEKVYANFKKTSSGYILKTIDASIPTIVVETQKYISSIDFLCNLSQRGDFSNYTTEELKNVNDEINQNNPKSVDSSLMTLSIVGKVSSNIGQFGHLITKGYTCPRCGKYIKHMPNIGFCSIKCFTEVLIEKAAGTFNGSLAESSAFFKKIEIILEMINIITNLILKMPGLLNNMAKLPDTYREYFVIKINCAFLLIKITINNLLISKNKTILEILRRLGEKSACIDKNLANANSIINFILTVSQKIEEAFNTAYQIAYDILVKTLKMYSIDPEGMGFFGPTSRSMINPLIDKDQKFLTQIKPMDEVSSNTAATSMISNVDWDKVNKKVSDFLPAIQPAEYFLDPQIFIARMILSNQNQKAITTLIDTLSTLCVVNADYLPKYSKLKLTNPWFLVALIYPANDLCWGQVTSKMFGYPYRSTVTGSW